MASGRCHRLEELPPELRALLDEAERGVMTTVDRNGVPHAVPVVFAVVNGRIVTPIDKKPKSTPYLGRRRNLETNPNVAFLVDRWSNDWERLAWVMIRGVGTWQPADDSVDEVACIAARYPRYRDTILESDSIAIDPGRISWWAWS